MFGRRKNKNVTVEIDYDKLRDAIIAANDQITERAEERKKLQFQDDFMTIPLVEIMNVAGIVIQIFLAVLIAAAFCYSWQLAVNCHLLICSIVFWALFFISFGIFISLVFKRTGIRKKSTTVVFGTAFSMLFAISVLVYSTSPSLTGCYIVSTGSGVVLIILKVIRRALRQEYDRQYLIAYFSALVSLAALFGSIIANLRI